jgi:hypothetical protein
LPSLARPTQPASPSFRRNSPPGESEQIATQAKLAEFPSYRVVASGALGIEELQKELRDGEAYYKMVMAGDAGYGMLITPTTARAYKLGVAPKALETQVDSIRDTITKVEDGQIQTFPFDVQRAYQLYGQLFEPVSGDMPAIRHLIFEPDGAMLRLPPNLLVIEPQGVAAYQARAKANEDAAFDFTGVKWLGRDRDVSTAVSARAFRDVRRAARSAAKQDYIGFGQNAVPAGEVQAAAAVRGMTEESTSCLLVDRPNGPGRSIRRSCSRPSDPRRSSGGDCHRRGLHRHCDQAAHRSVAISHHALCHPRPGHGAAPGMPGPTRADDLLWRRRVGRPAQLRRNLRPEAVDADLINPLRLRHRRQGDGGGDA